MNLGPKLIPKPMLKQALTPGLVQMVSILAMNKLELQEAIAQELLENPLLDEAQEEPTTLEELRSAEEELRRDAPADAEVLAASDAGHEPAGSDDNFELSDASRELSEFSATLPTDTNGLVRDSRVAEPVAERAAEPLDTVATATVDPFEQIDFGDFFQEYLDPGYRMHESEEVERPSYENFLSAPTTLTDHLRWQLSASTAPPEVRETAEAIIGNLDEDGYLTAEEDHGRRPLSLEEIAEAEQVELPIAELALRLVQSFDPPGVAARDLRECLMQQLKQMSTVDTLAVRLVDQYLPALQKRDYKDIAKALNVTVEEITAGLAVIQKLDPYPGRRYNKVQARLIEPDVYFVKGHATPCPICGRDDCENEYRVVTNDDGLPQLSLNRQYRSMKWEKNERDVARYIRDRYASAIQFLKNLEQRKQTIARVCHSIIARQAGFLNLGIDQLKPMMIKDVAEEIGVHPSTVSRAVANKYAHTPQGVYELRFFFTEAVQGVAGQETSLLILKRRVKKLIEEEDTRKPLTDDQITRILRDQGIEVTRRTVAKYREDMHIPSTHRRRKKDVS